MALLYFLCVSSISASVEYEYTAMGAKVVSKSHSSLSSGNITQQSDQSLAVSNLHKLASLSPGFSLLFEFLGTKEVMRLVCDYVSDVSRSAHHDDCMLMQHLCNPYVANVFSNRHPFIKDVTVPLICCGRYFRQSTASRETIALLKRLQTMNSSVSNKRSALSYPEYCRLTINKVCTTD